MPHKTNFHGSFAQALQSPTTDCSLLIDHNPEGDQGRRFNVYRNNRAVSLMESLQRSYPAICSLVGDEFFNAAARGFIDQHPPTGPVMAEYGREFGPYLTTLPNTETLPYLEDVATLEWQWLQSYHCENRTALQIKALAGIESSSVLDLRLGCHPALYVLKSRWPVGSIWTLCTQNSNSDIQPSDVDMTLSETVLITRPSLEVLVNIIPASGALFLDALKQGNTVGDAAASALEADPLFDTGTHLAGLLSLGVFSDLSIIK